MTRPAELPGLPPALPGTARVAARPALPPEVWAALTAHQPSRDRYHGYVCQRSPDLCWYWTGAISDTGHGKFRAGTRAAAGDGPPSVVVTAHVYGYRMVFGPPRSPGRAGALVIAHRCDESSCQNPAHWRLGTVASNAADFIARRGHGPLADSRGPAGRARAIAAAINAARTATAGATPAEAAAAIEAAIAQAAAAGHPDIQGELF